ncbi:hypothetical protein IPJ72_03660 [Candidatus Peregrinibacteria bacterium]|nr:MAG: hypothetical protein IPJ72_03660 [Candidatus Peregrinibacteria bacterium]
MKSLIQKTTATVGTSAAFLAMMADKAFAQGAGNSIFIQDPSTISITAKGDLASNITTLINYFLGLLGLIAVAFLIYAGVLMVTAGGNEDQVTKGRKIITYAVVGIVIILLSYTIVQFVANALG